MSLSSRSGHIVLLDPDLDRRRALAGRYQRARRTFSVGRFEAARELYRDLATELLPAQSEIETRHASGDVPGLLHAILSGESTGESGQRIAHAIAQARASGRTSHAKAMDGLCASVAQDLALLARYGAEARDATHAPLESETILRAYAHAVALAPGEPASWSQLANYEIFLGWNDSAIAHCRWACLVGPDDMLSWRVLGDSYARAGMLDDADAAYDEAIRIADTIGTPQWGVAMLRLQRGDFERGFRDYEARLTDAVYLHGARYRDSDLLTPKWDGEPFDGHLFVHWEQGAGDIIQFCRYLPWAARRVGSLTMHVPAGLVRLVRSLTGVTVQAAGDVAIPAHDKHLPIMSFPFIHHTTQGTVPTWA